MRSLTMRALASICRLVPKWTHAPRQTTTAVPYSVTPSARANSDGAKSKPRVAAVLLRDGRDMDQAAFHSAAAGGRTCWEFAVLSGWIFSGRSLGRADGLNLSRIA